MKRGKTILWVSVAAAAAVGAGLLWRWQRVRPQFTTIQGAVIRKDEDARRQLPIADAQVTAMQGAVSVTVQSDQSGYFRIVFPKVIWPGETVNLIFRRADYEPLEIPLKMEFRSTARRLIIAALAPTESPAAPAPNAHLSNVGNIRIRYTVNTEHDQNVGSEARTFQVKDQGGMRCGTRELCSPDGLWKASRSALTLDAGTGYEYRDVRASCIAGPCPFTRIDANGFTHGGRTIVVSALAWAGTVTFLVEAEVFRTSIGSNVRESYPILFDRTLNFTAPATQEGVSIEADLGGTPMVFPLGPDLDLSWATCTSRTESESAGSTAYRCELKPGYRFDVTKETQGK